VGGFAEVAISELPSDYVPPPLAPSQAAENAQPSSMWALLVGIETYQGDITDRVTGALRDVERMWDLLAHDMHIPPDHIIVLKNEEATREGILNGFRFVSLNLPSLPFLTYLHAIAGRT
jgi:hypothetical protein